MKILRTLSILFFISACNAPRAVYDYDQEADFAKYRTYAIYPEVRTGLGQLDEKRLLNVLEQELRDENLVISENPDFYLNVYSEDFREPSRSTLGVGLGGGGGNVGVGVSGGIPIGGPETYLRLTFDLIDARTDALVWQGIVESPFNLNARPEQREERFQKIVEKALKGYPPKR